MNNNKINMIVNSGVSTVITLNKPTKYPWINRGKSALRMIYACFCIQFIWQTRVYAK